MKQKKSEEQISCEQLDFDTVLTFVDNLIFTKIGRHLSDPEIILIKGSWDNVDYDEISAGSTYSANYLQRFVGPQLWNLISAIAGTGEKVTKKKLRNFLEKLFHNQYNSQQIEEKNLEEAPSDCSIKINGNPPTTFNFFGREQELNQIGEFIKRYKCVFLIGIAGIGKTALAAKILQQISTNSESKFDCLIWRSVVHTPTVPDLISELRQLIQPTLDSSQVEYTQAQITTLIKELQSRRCLIVLDEIDKIFQKVSFEQRLEYRLFFRRIIEEQHQSCFILTSRIFPNEFKNLIKNQRPLQYIKLKGLNKDAAMQFLLSQGLADEEQCLELIETYYGHPSELQSVVERINHFFAGSTKIFFDNKTTFISPEFQTVLDELFSKSLNQLECEIMIYLAKHITIDSELISFQKLLKHFNHNPHKNIPVSEIVEAIESLENQSLIENVTHSSSKEIHFSLQPVIKKYIFTDPLGVIRKIEPLSKISVA
ncbi:hypothetical protein A4S05_34880 [Nostoc sp. KVJ20]|uniref:NB-ARC domain-containing protein n=1 Tax=Nostoc sp. KVJ20 TaxID=457944 RepID=UPI00083DE945|nr:ATP-binding protein [Nostoc sp. KVJ20]ODH00081.1 hypothetical protein A4S05_34880 [Nostoc sp. KVJ20]